MEWAVLVWPCSTLPLVTLFPSPRKYDRTSGRSLLCIKGVDVIFGKTYKQEKADEQKRLAEAYQKRVRFLCILPRILEDGRWVYFQWVYREEKIFRDSSPWSGITYRKSNSIGSRYWYYEKAE